MFSEGREIQSMMNVSPPSSFNVNVSPSPSPLGGCGSGADDSSAASVSPIDVFFPIAQFIISVIGLIGNSQICVFYLKKRDKTPSEYIILNLGCVDFIYCLCNVLFTSYNKAVELFVSTDDDCDPAAQTSHTQNVLTGIYKASQLGLFTFVTNYSYACILIITINRYFAVCKPITYKVMCTFKISYSLLITAFVVALLSGVLDTYLIYYFFFVRESQSDFDTYNLLWFFIRLAFTSIDVITMGIVYYRIATSTTNLRQTLARCSITQAQPSMMHIQLAPETATAGAAPVGGGATGATGGTGAGVGVSSSGHALKKSNSHVSIAMTTVAVEHHRNGEQEEEESMCGVVAVGEESDDVIEMGGGADERGERGAAVRRGGNDCSHEDYEDEGDDSSQRMVLTTAFNTQANAGTVCGAGTGGGVCKRGGNSRDSSPGGGGRGQVKTVPTGRYSPQPHPHQQQQAPPTCEKEEEEITPLNNEDNNINSNGNNNTAVSAINALGKKISSCSSSRRTLSGRGLRGGRFGASLKGLRRGTTSSGIGGGGGMSQNRRKSSTENATYALFIISIGFIVFITPYTLMAAWQTFFLESTIDNTVHDVLFNLSMLVFNGNFISNYYVYMLFNAVFRNFAVRAWKRCLCIRQH